MALVEHVVELRHHVFEPFHVFGRHVAHTFGHLVELALHQLLAQSIHEIVEALLCVGGLEVVVLEPFDLAGEVLREQVELDVLLGDRILGQVVTTIIARVTGLVGQGLECRTFLADQFAQFLSDFVVDTAQVVVFEPLATFFSQLFEQFAQALNVVAVDVETLLQ